MTKVVLKFNKNPIPKKRATWFFYPEDTQKKLEAYKYLIQEQGRINETKKIFKQKTVMDVRYLQEIRKNYEMMMNMLDARFNVAEDIISDLITKFDVELTKEDAFAAPIIVPKEGDDPLEKINVCETDNSDADTLLDDSSDSDVQKPGKSPKKPTRKNKK